MTQLSAHLANQIHFVYSLTVAPWWPFVDEQKLCHIALPLSTKYNTAHNRHILMDKKFHHCGGTHCFDHSDLNEKSQALSHSDWSSTGHSDLTVDKQPHSKRSHFHLVNQSPFWSVLTIFHSSGCAQPMTTLHPPSITPQGIYSLSLTRNNRYLVSISPVTNPSKSTFHTQAYLSQHLWPPVFPPDFWAQYYKLSSNYPGVSVFRCWASAYPNTHNWQQYYLKGWLVTPS